MSEDHEIAMEKTEKVKIEYKRTGRRSQSPLYWWNLRAGISSAQPIYMRSSYVLVYVKRAEGSDDPLSKRVIRRLLLKLPSARFGILLGSTVTGCL